MNSRRKAIAPSIAIAIILVLSAALSACGGGQASNAPVTVEAVRDSKPLTAGWRFIQDDDLTDEQALASDAASWQSVSLPHTWNAIDAAKTEQTTPTSVNYKRGLGWYHLEFDAPASGATHWLQFDGASIVADVWLNGEKLGQHRGAFTTFRFDVTGKMRRDQKNVLVVKTDNRAPANNASITAIAPLSGDFNMSGGLYRDVTLISTPHRAHIALDDFGSSGIFAHTAAIEDDHATVRVRAKLRNSTAENAAYTVRATLLEADGKTVKSTGEQTIQVAANAQAETEQDIDVPQARLWQGVADPYLYKLVVEIRRSAGDTVDKVVHDFGIRQMAFDADKGFFLNGRPVPLRGVNMHQDFLGKAWAIGKADTDLSLSLIKDMGANTVRLAHYPHARYTLQQADRMGLVVMAELPFVNSASVPGAEGCNVDPETTGFAANAREQLRELIRQQINHASIGLWSIGNEVTTIAIRCGQTDESNNVQALLRSLHAMAKTEDPTRVTTLAQEINRSGDTVLPSPVTLSPIADTFSVNRYFLWYYGTDPAQFGRHLDQLHAENPTKPLGISEYGAGSALTHHTDNPLGGRVCSRDETNAARICHQPEGYANYFHEKSYETILSRDYLYGTYIWAMFDFGSGIRHEGDIGATNTKGVVTFDRQTRKDAFFFYKAHWTDTPVTHITDRRYTERAYPVADIKVYTNGESVTLKVNGATVGSRAAAQCPVKVCEFKAVPLSVGRNEVVAESVHAGQIHSDSVVWNLPAENMANRFIAAGQLTTGFVSSDPLLGKRTFGSDNFFAGGTPVTLPPMTAIQGLGDASIPDVGRVWDAYRQGAAFSYEIPLADGDYAVTLGFLEPVIATVGGRIFNVSANGAAVAPGLDILARAGAVNTATAVTFPVTVTGGKLKLDFEGVVGDAIVSNISVIGQ